MKINNFIKEYNFHDKRAYHFEFDKQKSELKFIVIQQNNCQDKTYKIVFSEVKNLKCIKNITKIDDYLLNIFKSKRMNNGIEIVFDNENFTTIYFSAENVEVFE